MPQPRPHIIGNISAAPFVQESFSEVFFEFVPFTVFTGCHIGGLAEVARILRPGGQLEIRTGLSAPEGQILARLRRLGFTEIQVERTEHLRITAQFRRQ